VTLDLYLLGPGVGESVVLVMPDKRVVVVDCCTRDGTNLPADLLHALGINKIDLLVVTHPDLDHIRGIEELVEKFTPGRVWRYPFGLLRELLGSMGRLTTRAGHQRYADALKAHDALDQHLQRTNASDHVHAGREWAPPGAGYKIRALAPTPYDVERARKQVSGLVETASGTPKLSAAAQAMFVGSRSLGDLPNMVSLGVVVEWGARKLVLAGDIENGDGSVHSGWPGVLSYLDHPDYDLGHLVNDVDVVKVAHHGSPGALHKDAWRRHAANRKTVAVLAPYSPTPLPHATVLTDLRQWVSHLGITAKGGASAADPVAAGWVASSGVRSCSVHSTLRLQIPPTGALVLEAGPLASWFQ